MCVRMSAGVSLLVVMVMVGLVASAQAAAATTQPTIWLTLCPHDVSGYTMTVPFTTTSPVNTTTLTIIDAASAQVIFTATQLPTTCDPQGHCTTATRLPTSGITTGSYLIALDSVYAMVLSVPTEPCVTVIDNNRVWTMGADLHVPAQACDPTNTAGAREAVVPFLRGNQVADKLCIIQTAPGGPIVYQHAPVSSECTQKAAAAPAVCVHYDYHCPLPDALAAGAYFFKLLCSCGGESPATLVADACAV